MKSSLILFLSFVLILSGCGSSVEPAPPAQPISSFNYSPQEISNICKGEQEKLVQALDTVGKVAVTDVTLDNTLLSMERATTQFANAINPITFLKYVSPDAKVRDASDQCETQVATLFVDIFVREDLFHSLRNLKNKELSLGPDESLLLKDGLTSFKRNGLELPADIRAIYIAKKKRLVSLETEFNKNLGEWSDSLVVTRAELAGLPESYIEGLEKTTDGKFKVTMAYPDYFPFMENAKNSEARKQLEKKFFNRGGNRNTELLEEAIRLRHELASLLGYPTHAHYVLERRMAKTPESVTAFLDRLGGKLRPKGESDLQALLKLKREEEPNATEVHSYEWRYFENQLKLKLYQVDHQLIQEYFPLDVVLNGMFEIYQTLLGVQFVENKTAAKWHENVRLYEVKEGENTIAFFYMDLFPREGKYGHAAAFTLVSGYRKGDGSYQTPSSSIVANFSAPSAGNPSLLPHGEVETLFHEFGHIMHQVLTTATYATFSGTSVKTDFVEAPSQMLENWVWEAQSLARLSGHYQNPAKPLPSEQIEKLVKAKLANVGIRYLRQLFFATLDMKYHTSATVDSTALYQKLSKDIMLIPIPDGTQPQASFGHLMGGYDAGYYGYLWSEVYAQDMFTRFSKEGLLNATTGRDYRTWILAQGGARDPFDLIQGFLGRAPNEDAFLKSLGLY